MATFTKNQRDNLADKGQAMPEGGFPIRNKADLQRAIRAYGRAKNPAAAKAWIIKRAKALNALELLPAAWASKNDKTMAHSGVLGMKWGRHLPGRTQKSHNPRPKKRRDVNPEHAEVHTLNKNHISTLSTAELHKVNQRLQAEKKYKDLNPSTIKKGQKVYKTVLAIGAASTAVVGLSQTPAGKFAIAQGKSILSDLLAGNGQHVLVTMPLKTTAKHLL